MTRSESFFSSASMAWISSESCSGHQKSSGNEYFVSKLFGWLGYVLLAPCPQREIVILINIGFLLLYLAFLVKKLLCSRRISSGGKSLPRNTECQSLKVSLKFRATLVVTGIVSLLHIGLCIWRFGKLGLRTKWAINEVTYTIVQALSWIVFGAIVGHENKFKSRSHPKSLCLWLGKSEWWHGVCGIEIMDTKWDNRREHSIWISHGLWQVS